MACDWIKVRAPGSVAAAGEVPPLLVGVADVVHPECLGGGRHRRVAVVKQQR